MSRAAMVVGTEHLKRLALSTTVLRMFRGMPEHLLDMRSFWEHSIAVGMLCHLLGDGLGLRRTESLFVGGLLHDVGTLLLCVSRPRLARRILVLAENGASPHDVIEREELGFTHAELGASLLEAWGLSGRQVAAARWHHEPSQAPKAYRPVADLVHVADVAVSALQIGNAGERAAHRLDHSAWNRTNLHPEAVDGALEHLEAQIEGLSAAITAG